MTPTKQSWTERAENILADRLQYRCQHDSRHVSADVLEGASELFSVMHCFRCGAVRLCHKDGAKGPWRRPRATWTVKS